MDRKAASMWKVTRNLLLTDVCAIALYWLIPSAKMLVLPLGVLCAIGYMLWLGRCFLNDCKANGPAARALIAELEKDPENEYSKVILPKKSYLAKKSIWIFGGDGWAYDIGETGAALLRIWRGNMVLVIVSLAVMAVLVWMG